MVNILVSFFVDVDKENPSKILAVHEEPILIPMVLRPRCIDEYGTSLAACCGYLIKMKCGYIMLDGAGQVLIHIVGQMGWQ